LVREKTVARPGRRKVRYDESRWSLLRQKRSAALPVMRHLADLQPIVHGSLARGDVGPRSDIDIVLTTPIPSFRIELALGESRPIRREIVQATPWHLVKGHIFLDEELSVTFPMVKPTKLEEQFYYFGGAIDLGEMEGEVRRPGIDKRLMLIEPTADGHIESSVVGREAIAAKRVGIEIDIVTERVEVLSKRDAVGRTGVYLKRTLSPEESFEDVLRRLAAGDPNLKRRTSL
jgi:predicted nucleotidyltransferase